MSSGQGDYPVGYARPPKEHRFRKGRSGNPKGRPKGTNNFRTDVVATLKAPVPIMENGKPRTVSTQLAVLMRLRERALRGDAKALDRYLQLAGAYNNEEPSQTVNAALPDADRAIIDRALARLSPDVRGGDGRPENGATAEPADSDYRGDGTNRLAKKTHPGGDGG